MPSRRLVFGSIASVALLILAGRLLSGWYVDYQWYASLGATGVWWSKVSNLTLLRGASFLVSTVFVFANLYAVRHSVVSLVLPRRVGNLEIGEEVSGRILLLVTLALSVIIGILLALPHTDWVSLELLRHGAHFGESDPYFALDLSYWLYGLPLERGLHGWSIVALVAILLVVTFLYALTPSLRWEGGRLHVTTYVRRHLLLLGAGLLLLLAWSYRLDAFNLLLDGSGPMGIFSAIDHRVGIPTNLVLAVLAIAAAMLVAWSGWTGQIRVAFATLTLMLLLALSARQIVPPIAERFVSPASPQARERPYQEIRNGYTRRAYDVDRLTSADAPAAFPSYADAVRGAATWDGAALARAIGGSRGGAVASGDLGWEERDGRLVAFSVHRQRGPEVADAQPAWGATAVAADLTDERGGTLSRDDADAMSVSPRQPLLVQDEVAGFFVLNDSLGRLVGPDFGSFWTRLAHAWSLQYLRLLSSEASSGGMRVLIRPDVRDRLHALFPFFEQGTRIAPIAWRDSIFWAVDLYSASAWYPLSQPLRLGTEEVRFLRRAGVALVNSHTGLVRAIADEQPDSMTVTWLRRFPSLFVRADAFDPELVRRIPPAIDAAMISVQAFAQVGVRGEFLPPARIPPLLQADTTFTLASTAPYFDRQTGLLTVALPLVEALDRLRGVVTIPGGAQFRPRWRALTSTTSPTAHWSTIAERLADPRDSLQRRARSTHGALRVLPTADGIVLFEAHYTTRPDGLPQVAYVSLFARDSIRVGSTLMEAAGMPKPEAAPGPLTPEEFRARVQSAYAAMHEALRRADWTAFGRAYEALGLLLRSNR